MTARIQIIGHRGARALHAENTLQGFAATAALGIHMFELDVGMTADGVVVVAHDPLLNPDITRDDSGRWLHGPGPLIYSLTHAELARFDVGRIRPGSRMASWFPDQRPQDGAAIPTLAAVLALLPEAHFIIEIKTDPTHPDRTAPPQDLTDATLSIVDAAAAHRRITIESFDWRVQHHLRRIRPDIILAWLTRRETVRDASLWWDGAAASGSIPARVAAEGGPVWAPDHADLSPAQIQEAHSLGLSVMPWTVNQPDDMRRLIAWGADGLISDRPDLACRVARDSEQTNRRA
jgi:glycerophosphoryl diester phosphodiesterase